MLCLLRRQHESFWVGDDVEIILDGLQQRRTALFTRDTGTSVEHYRVREAQSFDFRLGADDVKVTVLEVNHSGNFVRVGIAAPRHVLILRNELRERDEARRAQGSAASV